MLNKIIDRLKYEIKTVRRLLYHRLYVSPKSEKEVVERFHQLFYNAHLFGETWGKTRWLGVPTLKCPLDMWVYQEILFEERPDLIVECGTASGGSALYLASVCDLIGHGKILTVDLDEQPDRPGHPRITYLRGSSTSGDILDQVRAAIRPADRVLVILDSDHHQSHVLEELRLYGPLVSPGSRLIVEDTNLNGHPIDPEFGPGPMEAVEELLKTHPEFEVDSSKEKFLMTFNPRGYLKKIGPA